MLTRLSLPSAVLVSAALLAGLAGCAGASATAETGGSPGATISVVASTDVYGDIAAQIGGDRVSVTSLIDDPNKDPHEYQASGQNQLAVSKADIVIENGAGYDDFIDSMRSSAKNPDVVVLNAAKLSGFDLEPADGDFNEHLWYDFATVQKVSTALTDALSRIDPSDAATFAANAATFASGLDGLTATESDLKVTAAGRGVLITEPVPLYMLAAIGMVNRTPEAFSRAVENDSDAPPDVLAATTGLLAAHQVAILVYNSQTSGAQTDAVLAAAAAASIPVVPVTETLPAGDTYLSWMTQNLAALKVALTT
ncbi:metal ABC transporter solute-binding protein, Zn/Mn family [Subtercola endophyticus]|uniref:metal ABC transporter solute-binding protein, Zn/Mn family n=1 Tax=Subtercola endophyticus TaxID=2895559 RepID=UPI001E58258F|nr:zinc ABC transporter substrate-binding protein [Subtercola endophyticus]UFS58492.1 zinc ABC transporter substrate-binding protein [Subtercola endophyticus]